MIFIPSFFFPRLCQKTPGNEDEMQTSTDVASAAAGYGNFSSMLMAQRQYIWGRRQEAPWVRIVRSPGKLVMQ